MKIDLNHIGAASFFVGVGLLVAGIVSVPILQFVSVGPFIGGVCCCFFQSLINQERQRNTPVEPIRSQSELESINIERKESPFSRIEGAPSFTPMLREEMERIKKEHKKSKSMVKPFDARVTHKPTS